MTIRIGILMLVHDALDRAASVARFWHDAGCPVVIHVDSRVASEEFQMFSNQLSDLDDIFFDDRRHCEWGTWSLVEASQSASEKMLGLYPDVTHVFLASGACLPLRPVSELERFLERHRATDFIESVAVQDVPWAKGGLDEERFEFTFPFAWKRSRFLFDSWVSLQRLVRRKRSIPDGLEPHLGSQWWCLTRETLETIMGDPRRSGIERYFRNVWIPDESYFQTLVRHYGRNVESRSLTLSKFDFQGKPHIFYDDHMDLLRRSGSFVARKIWPHAEGLYEAFLNRSSSHMQPDPNLSEVDRTFARAVERRTSGRNGLNSAARFPSETHETGLSAAEYAVFQGLDDLFVGFTDWMKQTSRLKVHGHLYAPLRAEFADGMVRFAGGLTDAAALRDYNPTAFLQSLIWNTRGEPQGFLFGPEDNQKITAFLAKDQNARIYVISGAWAAKLFQLGLPATKVRRIAADLQRTEAAFLAKLKRADTRARVRIWTLAEFLDSPSEVLQSLVAESRLQRATHVLEAPLMRDFAGLAGFLQDLRNQGMNPHLAGDVAELNLGNRAARVSRVVR